MLSRCLNVKEMGLLKNYLGLKFLSITCAMRFTHVASFNPHHHPRRLTALPQAAMATPSPKNSSLTGATPFSLCLSH